MSDQTDVLQGTLDLLIMRTLTLEPMHGRLTVEVSKWERLSSGVDLVLKGT